MRSRMFKHDPPEDKALRQKLTDILGFRPRSLPVYKHALCHASAQIYVNNELYNNERLEFVGNAVLELVVSRILYCRFPDAREGRLSVLRSAIVSRKNLNKISTAINLPGLIVCRNYDQTMKNIPGNSLEALIGAVFFDRGYDFCHKFISNLIANHCDLDNILRIDTDYKSKLLQLEQKNKLNLQIHTFENKEANERDYHFLCEIVLDGRFLSEGKAWVKKEAEQKACKHALERLRDLEAGV